MHQLSVAREAHFFFISDDALVVSMVEMSMEEESPQMVGRRIAAEGGARGTVLFQGPVGATPGIWLGVEWDNPARGKHR